MDELALRASKLKTVDILLSLSIFKITKFMMHVNQANV